MRRLCFLLTILLLGACASQPKVDVLITGGQVFDGTGKPGELLDIGICGKQVCAITSAGKKHYQAKQTIDANGLIVSPGFIDPHTHTAAELNSDDKNSNQNYLFQGVTTVVNGNDGGGPADIQKALAKLNKNGIGTNVAMLTGHGSIRRQVLGLAQRPPTLTQLDEMRALVDQAMRDGALGFSSGLYYLPGRFADTDEVTELAKVAARYGGIYDTHLRDESTFNVGFLRALDEAIAIAEKSGAHLHLAHIKALGVDVWGQSQQAIDKINAAKARGVSISADQYPWQASGTNIRSAIVPKWAMADSQQAFFDRLNNPKTAGRIKRQIAENIRRRGGANALLVTASPQPWVGKTLQDLADKWQMTPVEATIQMVRMGRPHRVASFNMNKEDIERFMRQDWVVTSSDGTNGHPRKYASFPKKYQQYVVKKPLLTLAEFIQRSSGQTADAMGIDDRGYLQTGKAADIVIFDAKSFAPKADFSNWNRLSEGVKYILVNGQIAIANAQYTGALAGKFVKRGAKVDR